MKVEKETKELKVVEFLREKIFYKFIFPRELVANQGSQFTSNRIEGIMEEHHIFQRKPTPYYPQANGKVEVTNRALENTLTKVIIGSKRTGHKSLLRPFGFTKLLGKPPLVSPPMS